ncbi:unnamed protein product, partial [Brachionus calyciflorus]
ISNEFYEIITEYCILNDCLRANKLELYNKPLNFDYKSIQTKIPLRKTAMLSNRRAKDIKYIKVSCDCISICTNNRCKFFKSNEKCTSHCHLKSGNKCFKNSNE